MSELLTTDFTSMLFVLAGRVLAALLVIPLHAYAQGWAAMKLGDNTPQFNGRMTLDPTKHADPLGTGLMIITGMGWVKMVPINPDNFKNRRSGILLSTFAGMGMDLIVAFVCVIVFQISNVFLPTAGFLGRFFTVLALLTDTMARTAVAVAIFNLIPLPPADGWKLYRAFGGEENFWEVMRSNTKWLWIALLIFVQPVPNFILTAATWVQQGFLFFTSFIRLLG